MQSIYLKKHIHKTIYTINKTPITMETIIIYVLAWITLMTLILWKMPKTQIKAIQGFFKAVLPKVPVTGIIEAFKKKRP